MTSDVWLPIVLAAIAPTIAAFASVIVSWRNSKKLQDIHVQMNSRLDELVTLRTQAGHAEGVLQGSADKDEMRAMVKEAVADAFKVLPVVPVVISQMPPSSSGPTISSSS